MTVVAIVATAIGLLALAAPQTLLVEVKHAAPNPAALVMARTAGVGFVAVGVLNFSVRGHADSPTLRAVLLANLVLQLAILPIDPIAYQQGTFRTLGSFVPNTVLHLLLAAGFAVFWLRSREAGRPRPAA
ncbi:MAG: hypothetical protein AAF721_32695 [Myxococcota bacterium]